MKLLFRKILFYIITLIVGLIFIYFLFKPIFNAKSFIFPYAIHQFDIIKRYPNIWINIKNVYIVSFMISYSIVLTKIIKKINPKNSKKSTKKLENNITNEEFSLLDGIDDNNEFVKISEKGLYQNIFITGTIGSGKTSSAMYPFTEQIIGYKSLNTKEKYAMLILDVKGNYYEKVIDFSKKYERESDVCVIDLTGKIKYNPLDKPELTPIVLANRLKIILELFNKQSSESYWLDKAEQVIAEAIKFCRIYNDGYVNFIELHKLIMFPNYYTEKIIIAKEKFEKGILKEKDIYNLLSCVNFFDKEFFSLDDRTLSILKSEISRITNIFVSDYDILKSFCPKKEEINFKGFQEVLDEGKIVVLNMNIAEYKNLSKIIAAYLKLDFQGTVLSRLSNERFKRKSAFIIDEYQEYVTTTDADFFSQSREARCINIVATQSYTSLLNSLKDESSVKVIIQSLINKFWFRTDDNFTIEEAQKLIGKEEKEKISTTVSENAKQTTYNLLKNSLISRDTNISESFNKYTEKDYIYDNNYFSQILKTFESLSFISNGNYVIGAKKINMIPYFKKIKNNKLKGFDLNE